MFIQPDGGWWMVMVGNTYSVLRAQPASEQLDVLS